MIFEPQLRLGFFILNSFLYLQPGKPINKKKITIMNLEEAKVILRAHGRPTCPCKYNNSAANMIDEAIKLQNKQNLQK